MMITIIKRSHNRFDSDCCMLIKVLCMCSTPSFTSIV